MTRAVKTGQLIFGPNYMKIAHKMAAALGVRLGAALQGLLPFQVKLLIAFSFNLHTLRITCPGPAYDLLRAPYGDDILQAISSTFFNRHA